MSDDKPVVLRGQVLPREDTRDLHMPAGTPLGLGILGAARYAAIRRVLEEYERARRAKARAHDAEAEEALALTRRETAREQLRNIHLIVGDERNRIEHAYQARLEAAEIERMKRELEKLELEDRIQAVKSRRGGGNKAEAQKPDAYNDLLNSLGRIPGLAEAASKAKAEIINRAGGADKLSDAEGDIMGVIDAMVQGWVSKQAETNIL